jgi:hypothetical protein
MLKLTEDPVFEGKTVENGIFAAKNADLNTFISLL